jgi:hypothetical protein
MLETQQQDPVQPRRPYSTPRLVVFGDVLSLTLGGSPGAGDSGGSSTTREPKTNVLLPGWDGAGVPGSTMP